MAKKDFMPKTQDGYLRWHDTLKTGVTATTPGCVATDVTMLAADNTAIHAKMTAAALADAASKAAHTELNAVISTSQENVRKLARRIKNSATYTPAIGAQLSIEGADDSQDMTQQAPTLDTTAKSGGIVEVDFNKLGAEGVHIYSQRDGDAAFSFLASETHTPYVDTRPLLTAGKPEIRRYKAVFFLGKAEIGLESAVVEATARP